MRHTTGATLAAGRRARFLAALASTATVTEACDAAGVHRATAYRWRALPGVADLWDASVARAVDSLEAEAVRRARDGWEEPVFQQGRQVGSVLKFSDRMLELLLKRHRPEFREKAGDTVLNLDARTVVFNAKDAPDDGALARAADVLAAARERRSLVASVGPDRAGVALDADRDAARVPRRD